MIINDILEINEFPAKISRYESDKNCRAISHNLNALGLEHLHVDSSLFFIGISVEKNNYRVQ